MACPSDEDELDKQLYPEPVVAVVDLQTRMEQLKLEKEAAQETAQEIEAQAKEQEDVLREEATRLLFLPSPPSDSHLCLCRRKQELVARGEALRAELNDIETEIKNLDELIMVVKEEASNMLPKIETKKTCNGKEVIIQLYSNSIRYC